MDNTELYEFRLDKLEESTAELLLHMKEQTKASLRMEGKLDLALERTADNKARLDSHLEKSEGRIDDIKSNTAFRKHGAPMLACISFIVGWLTNNYYKLIS